MEIKNLEDVYELTPLQQDCFEYARKTPGEGVFHESLLFQFQGKLDVALFQWCWEQVVARQPILRTAFYDQGLKKPLQAVCRHVDLPFEVLDWSHLDEAAQDATLAQMVTQDLQQPYVLNKAPLMRMTLMQCPHQTYKFWWRFHHMLLDGWGFTLVLRDVITFYRASTQAKTIPPLPPALPYREYVAYLKHRDTGPEAAFWQHYLQALTPLPALSLTPEAAPSVRTAIRHGWLIEKLDDLYAATQQTIKAHELTLNAVFHGIFLLMLSRYMGGVRDVVTGSTAADRPLSLPQSHNRVGSLMNTLPIRYTIDPDAAFIAWVKKLQTAMLGVYQYSASCEHDIKRWCQFPAAAPLFEGVLVFENVPVERDPLAGMDFTMPWFKAQSRPRFPLCLFIWPAEDMQAKLLYDARRFSQEAAQHVLQDLRTGLERFLNHPALHVNKVLGV